MAVTLDALVRHFKAMRAHQSDGSIELCVAAETLEEAISLAATAAHPIYKKHYHQRRLQDEVLAAT